MRFKGLFVASAAVAVLGLAPTSAGAVELLHNGGFENGFASSGDSWTKGPANALDDALITTTNLSALYLQDGQGVQVGPGSSVFQDAPGHDYAILYEQREGDIFASLMADKQDEYTTVSQTFTLHGKATFTGYAAFLGEDYRPYNDTGYVRIYGPGGGVIPVFDFNIGDLGDYGYTPWTTLLANLEGDGEFRIEAGIKNVLDGDQSSYLLLDGFSVDAAVPEPTTWTMLILGFFSLGAALRRRRAVAA